jgi:NADH-quinone oxidoreductase subunit L
MLLPLVILAGLSVIAGKAFDVTGFLAPVFEAASGHGVEAAAGHGGEHHGGGVVLLLSILMVTLGIGGAFAVYQKGWIDAAAAARRLGPLYRLSYNKFYIDEIYNVLVVKPLLLLSRVALVFDLGIIDGIVNWWGRTTKGGGDAFAALQSGRVRDYLLFMSLGVVAVLGVWLWL